MKLAFSTNAFPRFTLLEALEAIAACGYDGVEVLADVPHAYPPAITPALTRQTADALSRLNLAVSNVNVNCSFGYFHDAPPEPFFEPSLISPNPKHRADRIAMIRTSLQFAKDIGGRNISITIGRMLPGMPPTAAARQFAESMKPVLESADAIGIDIGIESEPGLYLEYATELREWIDRLGHPRLGANLDVGHSQVIGEGIPDAVRLLGSRIWNVHVEDIPGRKHYHLIPGHGTLDWTGLREALDEIRYDRFLTVELYTHTADPHAAAKESFEFLKPRFG